MTYRRHLFFILFVMVDLLGVEHHFNVVCSIVFELWVNFEKYQIFNLFFKSLYHDKVIGKTTFKFGFCDR